MATRSIIIANALSKDFLTEYLKCVVAKQPAILVPYLAGKDTLHHLRRATDLHVGDVEVFLEDWPMPEIVKIIESPLNNVIKITLTTEN